MPLTAKKTRVAAGLHFGNERGQAVIEYTLILVITVALVLGAMQIIFKPMGEFISNYMGQYTACLLEYGELPQLGYGTPSEMDEDSECNKKFQPGTLSAGRPPVDSGSATNGGRSTTKKSSENRNPSNEGGGTNAGSASRGGGRNITNRRSFGTETQGGRPGKKVEIALENGGSGGFFGGGTRFDVNNRPRKTMAVGITGLTEAERKKLERQANGNASTVVTNAQVAPTKKRIPVKPPPAPKVVTPDEPFTIGNFIRYLFIAALVIALVLFIGGQALQMSKSGEK